MGAAHSAAARGRWVMRQFWVVEYGNGISMETKSYLAVWG